MTTAKLTIFRAEGGTINVPDLVVDQDDAILHWGAGTPEGYARAQRTRGGFVLVNLNHAALIEVQIAGDI